MLPAQTSLAIQTDILPIQNIGVLDQNQPPVYSILANSNSLISTEQPRRKKARKSDETNPVTINPCITRTPTGVTFGASHYRSMIPPESIPSCAPTRLINGRTIPFRLYLEHNSYDANNNINNNQISSLFRPSNPSLPIRPQQIPTWPNDSFPVVNTHSVPQLVIKSQLLGSNQLSNNSINERTASVPSPQQNGYKQLDPALTFIDQGSLLSHSHSLSSPLSSTCASDVRPAKRKRKYCKRVHSSAPIEQQPVQQTSSDPTSITQSAVSNDLPSTIPASVNTTFPKFEEHPLPIDISTASNFMPLSPPASIKSPPTNIINELSLPPIQQNLLPYTTTNIAGINAISKHRFPDQGFSHTQKINYDLSANSLAYNLHWLFTAGCQQYCMSPPNLLPPNFLPMTYSSILPETVTNIPSVVLPTDMKKERKKREKGVRKPKFIQEPTVEKLKNEQFLTSKSSTTNMPVTKKRKHKNSNTKDIRTKKQLRRITHRNRLAILKYMMRKQKQEKQQPIPIPQLSEAKVEQVVPKSISTLIVKSEKMEANLPDIVAPSLKISFDATQKIESIVLYYHRRRKSDITNENSPESPTITDNKLGLLIKAVDLIEAAGYIGTLNGSLKLTGPSNK